MLDYGSACSSVGIVICAFSFFSSSCLESSFYFISFLLNHFHKLDSKFHQQMEKNEYQKMKKKRAKKKPTQAEQEVRIKKALPQKLSNPIDFKYILCVMCNVFEWKSLNFSCLISIHALTLACLCSSMQNNSHAIFWFFFFYTLHI